MLVYKVVNYIRKKDIDSEEGDLNGSVKISNNIDYSTPGTYTIIYYVTNSKGITKVAYRNVNITD